MTAWTVPGHLTDEQVARTLKPVRAAKLETLQGATYVPHHEIRAELCRMFGPTRWDSQTEELSLIYEQQEEDPKKKGQFRWRVCYLAAVRLRVRDLDGQPLAEYREYHADESVHPSRADAHTNALTSAQSVALRRAAINIGDNMGLHLYDSGNHSGIVKGTLLNNQVPDRPVTTPEQDKVLADKLGATAVENAEGHRFTNRIDTPEQTKEAVAALGQETAK